MNTEWPRRSIDIAGTIYCLPEDFFGGLDKLAGADPANTAKLQERRIAYVLKTGANWRGPIKNFRLIADTGASVGRSASVSATLT